MYLCNFQVYLDMAESVANLQVVDRHLKKGGTVCFYAPSVSKLMTALAALPVLGIEWTIEGVYEESRVIWQSTQMTGRNVFNSRVQDDLCTGKIR